jgi:hypothetical protein
MRSPRHAHLLPLVVLLLVSCGGHAAAQHETAGPGTGVSRPAACPAAWRTGWQRLADRVHATVYCPAWMPPPLSGTLGRAAAGQTSSTVFVVPGRRYLVSQIWSETSTGEVHVNLAGYIGRTAVPRCDAGAGSRRPCFGGPAGSVRADGITATLYTVNQGPDQWHLLYAWRSGGSLYTISQHVALPLTDSRVHADLLRILRNLVAVEPTA